MKKIAMICAVLTFMSLHANAQTSDPKIARGGIGVRGGANFFNFGGNDASGNDYNNRIGFHAGLFSTIYLGESLAFEPGVFYSVKGTQNNDLANSRAVLNYVDIPVLFRVFANSNLNFFGGPQLSILTGSTFEGDLFGSTFTYDTESVNNTDFAVILGIGYTLPKGLNLQGSYNMGMTKVFNGSDAEIYNRGFMLSLGYTF